MNIHKCIALSLSLVQFPTFSEPVDYQLDFGVIIQNSTGEPVGFEKTTKIPIKNNGSTSLYGVVVTCPDPQQFTLNSVHILPKQSEESVPQKIMGKPMLIQSRGAIFMRTESSDLPGNYVMEVYINNKLHDTVEYQLLASHNQKAF